MTFTILGDVQLYVEQYISSLRDAKIQTHYTIVDSQDNLISFKYRAVAALNRTKDLNRQLQKLTMQIFKRDLTCFGKTGRPT